MTLMSSISKLTTSVDKLTNAANVTKAQLDAKVAQADAEVVVAQAEQTGAEAAFAADQQEGGRPIGTFALGHGDRLFQANGADVFDDFLKDLHIAVARVQDFDPVDGDERDALGCVSHHWGVSRA
jgi:hypothetical protein